MKYSKKLFWSQLDITIEWDNINTDIVDNCFDETEAFEQKYSRFIKNNFLDNLNTNKSSTLNKELLYIINLCQKVSELTEGYFDITILPLLENMGYGIKTTYITEDIWYKNIEIQWSEIILKNWISIDIWAVWKWYMIDKIYNILHEHFEQYIINFGWDIRVKWNQEILLEDPHNDNKYIWKININNLSIASSTGSKRKIKTWHHLINPKTKKSQNDKQAIYITHKLSSFSDIFSTALFVCPLEKAIEILNQVNGLEWMIISSKWEIFKSNWFNCTLH